MINIVNKYTDSIKLKEEGYLPDAKDMEALNLKVIMESMQSSISLIKIPLEYETLYHYLAERILDYGVDLVKDCNASKLSCNKKLLECWAMFQAACIAYEDNEKESKFLINYIVKTMKLTDVQHTRPVIKLSKTSVTDAGGEFIKVPIYVNKNVTSFRVGIESDWCSISPNWEFDKDDQYIGLMVDTNMSDISRSCTITFICQDNSIYNYKLIQEARSFGGGDYNDLERRVAAQETLNEIQQVQIYNRPVVSNEDECLIINIEN